MFLGAHSLYYCDNLRAVTACFPDCTIGPQAKGLDRNALQNQMPVVGVSWGMSRLSPAWSPPDSKSQVHISLLSSTNAWSHRQGPFPEKATFMVPRTLTVCLIRRSPSFHPQPAPQ